MLYSQSTLFALWWVNKYGVQNDASIQWWKSLGFDEKFEFSSEVYYRKIQKHLEGCGKKDVGSKGYKVFTVSYIHDVYVINDQGAVGKKILKGLCFRRQRKSEEPHKLSLKCESEDKGVANVVQKSCSYFYGVVTFGRPHFELISVNPHAQD